MSDLRPPAQARQLHDRPAIESVAEKYQRKEHAARQFHDRPSIEHIEDKQIRQSVPAETLGPMAERYVH